MGIEAWVLMVQVRERALLATVAGSPASVLKAGSG